MSVRMADGGEAAVVMAAPFSGGGCIMPWRRHPASLSQGLDAPETFVSVPRKGVDSVFDSNSLLAMTDEQRRESLCRVVGELGAQGWCQGTGGNFSLALSQNPMRLLITRSGVDKRRLGPADLMLVGEDAQALPGETGRPSAETAL